MSMESLVRGALMRWMLVVLVVTAGASSIATVALARAQTHDDARAELERALRVVSGIVDDEGEHAQLRCERLLSAFEAERALSRDLLAQVITVDGESCGDERGSARGLHRAGSDYARLRFDRRDAVTTTGTVRALRSDAPVRVTRVSERRAEQRTLESQLRILLGTFLVAVGVALIGAHRLGRRIARPIADLAHGVRAEPIDAGSIVRRSSLPVPARTPRELVQLRDDVLGMLAALDLARAERERVLADAAHELRAPLAAAALTSHAIEHDTAASAGELHALGGELTEQLREVAELLDDLVLESRGALAPTDRTWLSIGAIASDRAARWRTRWPALDLSVHDEVGRARVILADVPLLARALDNAVANAATHGEAPVHVHFSAAPDGRVSCVISDSGRGFSDDARVGFAARGGASTTSGLGGSIIAKAVAEHDGELRLGSTVAGGARVEMLLPARTHEEMHT